MTLESLRCFCAVVETGSFREAAARVFRSQPAVSQQIKTLERELGHTLIDRRSGAPTAVGEVLYHRGRALVLSAEGLREELADLDETWSRDLRVGSSDTTALYMLPRFVKAFAGRMPDTRLVTVSRSTDAIIGHVLNGDVDLGIVTLPCAHRDLDEQPLWKLKLAVAVPRGHPLADRTRVRLQHLAEYPYLALQTQTRTGALLWEHFRSHAVEPQVVLDSGSFEVIKRYVAEGLGISLLPEPFVSRGDGVVLVHVAHLPVLHIGAIWRRGAYQSRATREFLALLRADAH